MGQGLDKTLRHECQPSAANISSTTMSSSNQLISAMQYKGNQKVLELLDQMDVGEVNKVVEGTTALHVACGKPNDKALDKLLNKTGIDVNIKDACGFTPLHKAVLHSNVHAVSRLLASPGIQVNCPSSHGMTPVMFSAVHWQVEILKLMLKDSRVDLDTKDRAGNGLEEMVSRANWRGREKEKETCKKMINNKRMKQKSGQMEQQPSKDGSIGRRIEKVDRLNKQIGDEEKKMKRNVEINKQKIKNLAKKHKEEQSQLETTIKTEDETSQRYIGLLTEQRDELVRDLQKIRIDPVQDASEDRDKLEAALNKQEDEKRALECPVCFQFMRPPTKIWMCEFSHLICEACKDALQGSDLLGGGNCPTCTTQPITLRAHKSEEFARIIFN